jgi:hypothetical protein
MWAGDTADETLEETRDERFELVDVADLEDFE